ncbi:hypothetical protein [Nostoc sp. NMS7]|nr:hypothetical protein [Nostoc sp. NMS7]
MRLNPTLNEVGWGSSLFYRPIETGIEVLRVVSGYRDLDALFDQPDNE